MKKEKIVVEERMDEGLRTFKDGTVGTIRTIESGGGKRVIEGIKIMGNYSPSEHEASRVVDKEGIASTVKENHGTATETIDDTQDVGYRIRKLTPKECWRLMGFTDNDFEKAKEALNQTFYNGKDKSNSQLYKQAGNSIVTDVLYYIFKELYSAMPYLFEDLKVSSYFSGIGAFEVALDRLFDEELNKKHFQGSQKRCVVYDDYNSRIRGNQNTVGTITSTIANSSLKNSYKLIES